MGTDGKPGIYLALSPVIVTFYLQEYKLALYHCYGRYVDMFKQEGASFEKVAQYNIEDFQGLYFPGGREHQGVVGMVIRTTFILITVYITNYISTLCPS